MLDEIHKKNDLSTKCINHGKTTRLSMKCTLVIKGCKSNHYFHLLFKQKSGREKRCLVMDLS
jgi:hypothetical protein